MKRDPKLITVFSAVAVLSAGAVGVGIERTDPPPQPPAVVSRDVAIGPDGVLSVQFVGDTMLGGAVQPLIDQFGYDWPLQFARESLTGDLVVATAEAPISTITLPWDLDKPYSYSSRPEAAGGLARAGIDAITLANNHTFDLGPFGLTETMVHAEAAGMATFGAGPDLARAEQPLLLRTRLGTIGVVGMGESFGARADDDEAGTVVFNPETVRRGVDLARAAGAHWVIAHVHWGDNYAPIDGQQRYWAQQLADAGYDMVVGSGPHYAQPIEFIGAMPVVYSVGNFVFGARGRFRDFAVPGLGLAVSVELSPDRAAQLSVRCLLTDNDIVAFQPRPCTPAEAQANLPILNPTMSMHGDVGVLPCGCFARRDQQ